MKIVIPIIFLFLLSGCSDSPEYKTLLDSLNNKYPNYIFSDDDPVYSIYMRVDIKKNNIDTSEIKSIINFYEIKKQEVFTQHTQGGWVYMMFYDINGNYLFKVRKDISSNNIIFSKQGYRI